MRVALIAVVATLCFTFLLMLSILAKRQKEDMCPFPDVPFLALPYDEDLELPVHSKHLHGDYISVDGWILSADYFVSDLRIRRVPQGTKKN